MSGLSEERLDQIKRLRAAGTFVGPLAWQAMVDDLLAESAALRTERDEAWADALKNNDALGRRVKQCEDLQARLAAPASPDDLARVASELAAEVCRCADCVPYGQPIPCDRARIADRLRNPLAVALARLTPPTGPA